MMVLSCFIKCHGRIKSYQLMLRKYACLCEPCLQLVDEYENYASLDSFLSKTVNLPLKNGHEQSDGDEDDEEFGCHGSIKSIASFELPQCFPIPILHVPLHEEHEVWEWENSVAVQMIQPNVVVI